jgi:hypothetical protein
MREEAWSWMVRANAARSEAFRAVRRVTSRARANRAARKARRVASRMAATRAGTAPCRRDIQGTANSLASERTTRLRWGRSALDSGTTATLPDRVPGCSVSTPDAHTCQSRAPDRSDSRAMGISPSSDTAMHAGSWTVSARCMPRRR